MLKRLLAHLQRILLQGTEFFWEVHVVQFLGAQTALSGPALQQVLKEPRPSRQVLIY